MFFPLKPMLHSFKTLFSCANEILYPWALPPGTLDGCTTHNFTRDLFKHFDWLDLNINNRPPLAS